MSRIVLLAAMLGCAALSATAAPAATTYTITDLGSLGLGITYGYGINAGGAVTGGSYLSTSVTTGGCPGGYDAPKKCTEHPEHAYLYSNGKLNDLGTLGGNNSEGRAVNLNGQVAGWSDTKSSGLDAFFFDGRRMVDLGTLGPLVGQESKATWINGIGEVVGWFGFNPGSHAFLHSNGVVSQLPDLSSYDQGGVSKAAGINDNNQAVGSSDDANGNSQAVLWANGTITALGTLGGASSSATAINNLGQIVGTSTTSSGSTDGFLYNNGQMTDLGAGFTPEAINGSGVIVGQAAGHAAIYSNGTLHDLNNLIPAGSGYTLEDATAINDNGQIVVAASLTSDATNASHTLLLTP